MTVVTAWIEFLVCFKVAALARYLQVLAFVLVPMLCMCFPLLGNHIPGSAWIMARVAVVITPVGVSRLVAVSTYVVKSFEVGILVAGKADDFSMLARERDWMNTQCYFVP
jgi:hypothetical protein